MKRRIFVPADTTAAALGADAVAALVVNEAARRGEPMELVRNGSRGAYWLEPLLEVEDDNGRRAFGPVRPEDIPELFAADFPAAGEHPLALGDIEAHPWLAQQTRVTFARAGIGDPLSLDDYRAQGGLQGLARAASMTPQAIVDEIKASGLRGRGGAAFLSACSWYSVDPRTNL